MPPKTVPKEPLKKPSGTYDEIKEAARRSGGDPVREWMSGSSTTGSIIYKAAKADFNQLYSGTKRSVEEGGAARYEEGAITTLKIKEHQTVDTLDEKMDNMKEKFGKSVSSLIESEEDKDQAMNARAISGWEASRTEEEQKKKENATRKSQVTDK